jgi:hypothetical protein
VMRQPATMLHAVLTSDYSLVAALTILEVAKHSSNLSRLRSGGIIRKRENPFNNDSPDPFA